MIAICSATQNALISLEIGGNKHFIELDEKVKHSENILPCIENLLLKAEKTLFDNDVFAVVVGPGSFTGIRVGVALVKGLSAGSGQKVVPLSTLEFMAYTYIKNNKPNENFGIVMNALSGFIFFCEFNKEGKKVGEEKLITKDELEILDIEKVGLESEDIATKKVRLTSQNLLDFAILAKERGDAIDAHKLVPVYLRKSQAEDNLDKRKS